MTDYVEISHRIADAIRRGNKILICGNGGLAAESEHFTAELVGKYGGDVFIPCISLTSNSSVVTAIANDYGYDHLFSHQIKALGKAGDIFIGMTTSFSPNIKLALKVAKEQGLTVICFCGFSSPELQEWSDIIIRSSHKETTASIQEEILSNLHIIALEVKRILGENK